MLEFSSEDPFPLATNCSYEEQKAHAARVDEWLGLQTEAVENQLRTKALATTAAFGDAGGSREFWVGKPVQTFSTPYTELREVLEELKPKVGQSISDLGAGYGRMAHVLARHFAGAKFVGYELVPERQAEAQRAIDLAQLKNAQVRCADVAKIDFLANPADFYFMYDFGSRADVEICVENLKRAARSHPITIVARGGRSRDIIEKSHPWLSQVVTPLHRDHYSIYRSRLNSDPAASPC
jgi:SAM-dependent methyltransferase